MNGLADPSAIIQTFWVDEGLGSLVRLHQSIALVDAKSFPQKFKSEKLAKEEEKLSESPIPIYTEKELLLRQLIYADKILLNKTDLLIPEQEKEHQLCDIIDII